MKLLLDENLSRRIIPALQEAYPDSTQIALLGLNEATDREIWGYAREEGFSLVTQDADFHELSLLEQGQPLVIWLRCGNTDKKTILAKLIANRQQIEEANQNDEIWCIEIY
jgi:predicted nuclease of predicted toxin-antitoxin system